MGKIEHNLNSSSSSFQLISKEQMADYYGCWTNLYDPSKKSPVRRWWYDLECWMKTGAPKNLFNITKNMSIDQA